MMPQNQTPLPFPEDWRERVEELLEAGCRVWQMESQRPGGRELSPGDIYPDAPKPFRRKLGQEIEAMRSFEGFMDRGRTELHSSDFTVIKDISTGGQGTVVLATDHRVGREVAIKIPHEDITQSGIWERLVEEASMMGNLQHPGVIPVFGLQRDDVGRPFLIMRHVEHEHTLGDEIDNTHRVAGDFHRADNLRSLLRQFVKVCDTVQYAHDHNVIHRDLKPDNILVGDYGEVFVVDFGIAQILKADAGVNRFSGTPAYMSPEQTEKEAAIDKRTDVYGLGATLYHLLTGQLPFLADTSGASGTVTTAKPHHATIDGDAEEQPESVNRASILQRVRKGDKLKPRAIQPSIPKALEAICLKAMSVEPGERYSSASGLAAEIDRWLDEKPVAAYPDPWTETVRRWMKRHRTLVTGAGAALMVLMIASTIAVVLIESARRRERSANEALAAANKELRRPRYATQFLLAKTLQEELDVEQANLVLDATDEDMRGLEWHYLKQACREPKQIERGAPGDLIALSADGSLFAVATSFPRGGDLRVFDTRSGQLAWPKKSMVTSVITALRFDAESKRVAVIRTSSSLGSAEMLKAIQKIPLSTNPSDRVRQIMQESQRLEKSTARVTVLNARTGESLDAIEVSDFESEFPENQSFVSQIMKPGNGVQFKNRGQQIQEVLSIQFPGRTKATHLIPHMAPLRSAAINHDHSLMATAHGDGGIRIWGLPTERLLALIPAGTQEVKELQFLQDNTGLIWTGAAWEMFENTAPQQPAVWTSSLPEPPVRVNWSENVVDEEGKQAPATASGLLPPWLLTPRKKHFYTAISANGRTFASMDEAGRVKVWNVDTGIKQCEFRIANAEHLNTWKFDFVLNSSGSLLAHTEINSTSEAKSNVRLIDARTGKTVSVVSNLTAPLGFDGDSSDLFAFRPKGKGLVVVNSSNGTIKREFATDPVNERNVYQFDFSRFAEDSPFPHGCPMFLAVVGRKRLVVQPDFVSRGREIQVWDSDRGRYESLPWDTWNQERYGSVHRVTVSPRARWIAAYSRASNLVQVREVDSWRIAAVLRGHQQPVNHVAFSSDETRIATAGKDGTVKLWDVNTGALLWTFLDPASPAPFWFVKFGAGDEELTAGSRNGIVTWTASRIPQSTENPKSGRGESVSQAGDTHNRIRKNGEQHQSVKKEEGDGGRKQMTFGPNLTLDATDITRAAKSHDGQRLAIVQVADRSTESADWFLTLFDLREGTPVFQKKGLGEVLALRFDAADKRLAEVVRPFADDRAAMKWRLRQAFLGGPSDDLFTPDDNVEIPDNAAFVVWNAMTGESLSEISLDEFKRDFRAPVADK